jgi:hypothetical protein
MLNVNQRTNNFNHFAVMKSAHSTSHEHHKLVKIVLHKLLCFLHERAPQKMAQWHIQMDVDMDIFGIFPHGLVHFTNTMQEGYHPNVFLVIYRDYFPIAIQL